MKQYGVYLMTAYGIAAVILIINVVIPLFRYRLLKKNHARILEK